MTLATKKFSEAGRRMTNVDMALPSCRGNEARDVAGPGKSLKVGRGSESETKLDQGRLCQTRNFLFVSN